MRRMLTVLTVALALVFGPVTQASAAADDAAPCIGETASTVAPILREGLGRSSWLRKPAPT